MYRIIWTILLCVAVPTFSQAQAPNFTFGEVMEEDMLMEAYSRDPEAEALILYDKGESKFIINKTSGGFSILFKRTKRIKILKTSGLDLANVTINYVSKRDGRDHIVSDIKAFSHNMEAGVYRRSELEESAIFDENEGDGYRSKKLAIPNVKVGSIIEYQYTILFTSTIYMPDWEFQNGLPTRYSEYEVNMIPFYEFTYLMQGRSKFDYTSSHETETTSVYAGLKYKDIVYRFGMKNLPAFRDHSFISSVNDYIIKMDWQLATIHYPRGGKEEFLTTWPELSNTLAKYESYGKYISASQKAYKKLSSKLVPDQGVSDLEKAKLITSYVKENFSWNGDYRRYTDKSVKKFQSEKEGSTAEINLFLVGLLKGAGLDAKPVLISTRGHGKIKTDYPFESFFNSSIVLLQIENQYFLTEGTEPMLPFGALPPECINEKGLIIEKDSESWVDLTKSVPSVIQENMNLELNPDDQTLAGEFTMALTRYDAMFYRKSKSRLYDQFKDNYELTGDVQERNLDNPSAPYILIYYAKLGLEIIGEDIYLKPFLNKPVSSNPLKAKTRAYPIDFIYSRKYDYKSRIKVPDGYTVKELPQGTQIDDEILKFTYSAQQSEGTITVSASYTLKKPVYLSREYRRLRDHFNTLIDKLNEHIVFEKN